MYKDFIETVKDLALSSIRDLFDIDMDRAALSVTNTKKEFEGDYTVVLFPLVKILKGNPDEFGHKIGAYLVQHCEEISAYNIIKGFLNLSLSDTFMAGTLAGWDQNPGWEPVAAHGETVIVEFSSPNTNKPLHLGHIRNISLGWSVSKLLTHAGYDVRKVQIINDRGIAICKSMLAWQLFGDGVTPETAGQKSDHFVGDYYVMFEKKFQEEYMSWQQSAEGKALYDAKAKPDQPGQDFFKAFKNTYFNEYSALGGQARDMLLKWEENDPEVRALWQQMNTWVYEGFDETYKRLGVDFDELYYESETYLLGKDIIEDGLKHDKFIKEEDGSVWMDLTEAGLDRKLVLRKDGTSVYMTQDIGTAIKRYQKYKANRMIYVVADEQNYHFQVLFEMLKRLEQPFAAGLYHLSYGMVDLTTGKMKSREGTVVDADDLMDSVTAEARHLSEEKGELSSLEPSMKEDILHKIGLGALKFFIIKVHPHKRMTFDPVESVDMQGQTAPYIQNAYVRIQSILRKAGNMGPIAPGIKIAEQEREVIAILDAFHTTAATAAAEYDPSLMANYCYALAKAFHRFYHDLPVLNAPDESEKNFRLHLCASTARALATGMDLLGIQMPERM